LRVPAESSIFAAFSRCYPNFRIEKFLSTFLSNVMHVPQLAARTARSQYMKKRSIERFFVSLHRSVYLKSE